MVHLFKNAYRTIDVFFYSVLVIFLLAIYSFHLFSNLLAFVVMALIYCLFVHLQPLSLSLFSSVSPEVCKFYSFTEHNIWLLATISLFLILFCFHFIFPSFSSLFLIYCTYLMLEMSLYCFSCMTQMLISSIITIIWLYVHYFSFHV